MARFSTAVYIKSKGCLSSTIYVVFITRRTNSNQNLVHVNNPYYMHVPEFELLAYDALALIGTAIDKGKVRNRGFRELTDGEEAGFIRFIKNTNPECEMFTTKQMLTFARQLLNMRFQSYTVQYI